MLLEMSETIILGDGAVPGVVFEGEAFADAEFGDELVGLLDEFELFLGTAVPQQFNIGEAGADALLAAEEFKGVVRFFVPVDFVGGIKIKVGAEGGVFLKDLVDLLEGHHLFRILYQILEVLLGPERLIIIDPEGP